MALGIKSFPSGELACNCTIIYDLENKKGWVIDPGTDFELVKQNLEVLGVQLQGILHTHAHFDHIGWSAALKQYFKTTMHLHREDLMLYKSLKQQGMFFGLDLPDPGEIDYFIEDEEEFEVADGRLQAIYTPGHTAGSVCFCLWPDGEAPTLFSGDTLFKGSIGRTDLPGGDHATIIRSIKNRLMTLPDEIEIVPGHGSSTRLFEERRSNPFLR